MINIINLPKREETSERYDANRTINEIIAKTFEESKAHFTGYQNDIKPVTAKEICFSFNYEDVPYGINTLGKAGCAVFCLEHGLRIRDIKCDIKDLAREIADKGYYLYGKGTYHNLFDHFGLRRATDVIEIFDSLKMGKIITVLVKNSEYSSNMFREDSHFVNIVGKMEECFIIDDSHIGRIKVNIEAVLKATRVAWIW